MLLHEATPKNLYFLQRNLFCFILFLTYWVVVFFLKIMLVSKAPTPEECLESFLMQFTFQYNCNVNKLQINVLWLLISEEMCFNIVRSLGSFSVLYFPLREKRSIYI